MAKRIPGVGRQQAGEVIAAPADDAIEHGPAGRVETGIQVERRLPPVGMTFARRFESLPLRCLLLAAMAAGCQTALALTPKKSKLAVAVTQAAPARASEETRRLAGWVTAAGDSHGLPFLIVDKRQATVSAFDASGRLLANAPALLGLARGDDSVPGIGERKLADIRPEERTTPAGRFAAEMGANSGGEEILWVDYDAAVSLHRVRTAKASDRRLQRLATPTPLDNRISYGCINVPAAFFDRYVKPLFTPRDGIVYVLPDTKPTAAVFEAAFTAKLLPH
ncbi:MAG: L,D-transpeptidase [Pseudomonadota bacterium]|nr:L,D-transpeptidase [Pseudomonadota bacterium]